MHSLKKTFFNGVQNTKTKQQKNTHPKPTLSFVFKWGNIVSLYICALTTKVDIFMNDLLDLFNNHMKFQLNWIRALNFQLQLFVTAVTLKHGQGHWRWYTQVRQMGKYHHAKFDIQYNHTIQSVLGGSPSCDTYGPFDCISFHKSSRKFSFSICSSDLISALLVLTTIISLWKSA